MNFTDEDLATEEWRDVPEFDGLYQVSNLGRVKSLDRIIKRSNGKILPLKGRLLKPETDKNGYQLVHLSKDGEGKKFLVHRLVYIAFNGEIPEGMEVNHINEVKSDNQIENLNLMTHAENVNWGTRNQRSAKARINHPIRSKPVVGYDEKDNVVVTFPSASEAERNGFYQSNVAACCRGERLTYKGLIWKYVT